MDSFIKVPLNVAKKMARYDRTMRKMLKRYVEENKPPEPLKAIKPVEEEVILPEVEEAEPEKTFGKKKKGK